MKSERPPRQQKARVPMTCPQCPDGNFDLLGAIRREGLIRRLGEILGAFGESGEINILLDALEQLLKDGLAPADLNRMDWNTLSGNIGIRCESRENSLGEEITLLGLSVDHLDFFVDIPSSEVEPVPVVDFDSCPLIGPEDYRICDPDQCETIKDLRGKLKLNHSSQ